MAIIKKLKAYLLVVYAFLLVLHFILKDQFYPLSILFYMTPLLAVILYGIVSSIILRKTRVWFYTSVITTLFLIAYWLITDYGLSKTHDLTNTKHIAVWNIADQQFLPRPFIEKHLAIHNPEIIAFVEAKKISVSDLRYLHEKFPKYDIQILKGHMVVMIKGQVLSSQQTYLKTNSKFNHVTYKASDGEASLLLVDVSANPIQNRAQDLKTILEFCNAHPVDFILGDFNTPYESVHFDAYSEKFTSFHGVSNGFTSTWPYGFPLLELDQIWVSNNIETLRLEKTYSSFSDHALLMGSYKLKAE